MTRNHRNRGFWVLWPALLALIASRGYMQDSSELNEESVVNKVSVAPTESSEKLAMPKLSVQLWSVRDNLASEFEETLSSLAEMGFNGVEFANEFGEYEDNPEGLRLFLDSIGLQGSGAHLSFEQLNPENFDATISFYEALGIRTLIIGWDERGWHPVKVKELVNELNAFSEKLKDHEMQIGYHNHQYEFEDFEGATYWDYIAQNTHQEVVLQLDVAWVVYAGKDPASYVKQYPGRTQTTHYKVIPSDGAVKTSPIVGEDTLDWLTLSQTNIEFGGTQWFVIEQEVVPVGMTPMQAVHASKQGLEQILAGQ